MLVPPTEGGEYWSAADAQCPSPCAGHCSRWLAVFPSSFQPSPAILPGTHFSTCSSTAHQGYCALHKMLSSLPYPLPSLPLPLSMSLHFILSAQLRVPRALGDWSLLHLSAPTGCQSGEWVGQGQWVGQGRASGWGRAGPVGGVGRGRVRG